MESEHINIIVEANIPFIKGILEPYANVRYLKPEEINADSVKEADALVIRTRTRCNESLLKDSKVRFIATATIGTDHIDLDWCKEHGITVANAPGCNAPAVAQYVLSAVHHLSNRPIDQYAIGIIGVGHVGSIIEQWARQLGMTVLVNDPPREKAEGGSQWSTLDDIAEKCDVITIHTPLDNTTRHLIDERFLSSLRRSPILINAARGGVADDEAVTEALNKGKIQYAVIDCWENEPNISSELLHKAIIATPHIAGYSYEGKVRATRMVLDALSQYFNCGHIDMAQQVPDGNRQSVSGREIAASYDPNIDTKMLKANPDSFESLRNHYALRHEVGITEKD